ncbi:formylglycine-generating enzyme family protein [Leucothrix arctica]|uniref:Sulfatase-modifying factor enzyme-like domain-containing protein n=1 Tax=Leucothrix arctica TaxID=1481894 RepID=A0A317CPF9_9GAMM|nr:SUMF1/EgtB/PvdO family nonheme iron enzyme [Leucothrix arctica]PWQ99353.1 hypothetical protein DKT75_01240 [Leucothrix arctica]
MKFLFGLILSCIVSQTVSAETPTLINIPSGTFIQGSDDIERETAYALDEAAYGHSSTRQQQWYAGEFPKQQVNTAAYRIIRNLVTMAQYQEFITETKHPAPQISKAQWASYGVNHSYESIQAYQWHDGKYPKEKANHPVVLVNHNDASNYAKWLSKKTGQHWRLPYEVEWEKAARGVNGNYFPWGNTFDATRLNTHDNGKFGTAPVGQFPQGASPFGLQDAAGQVFEWTQSKQGNNRMIVKGGSWDDKGCGVCRPAARHGRPSTLKHTLIGFRLVQTPN